VRERREHGVLFDLFLLPLSLFSVCLSLSDSPTRWHPSLSVSVRHTVTKMTAARDSRTQDSLTEEKRGDQGKQH